MPVVQAPIDRGKNRYSVAYAFRPGENGVRYSYDLPYAGNAASVKISHRLSRRAAGGCCASERADRRRWLASRRSRAGHESLQRDNLAGEFTLSVSVSGNGASAQQQ